MLPSKLHLRELCVLPFIEVINFENYLRRENGGAQVSCYLGVVKNIICVGEECLC